MTLNGVMAVILPYFSEFGYLPAYCVKVHVRFSSADEFLLTFALAYNKLVFTALRSVVKCVGSITTETYD